MPVESFFHISTQSGAISLKTREDAISALSREGFVWIDIAKPDKQTLSIYQKQLGLFQLAIDSCLDKNHVPKMINYCDILP